MFRGLGAKRDCICKRVSQDLLLPSKRCATRAGARSRARVPSWEVGGDARARVVALLNMLLARAARITASFGKRWPPGRSSPPYLPPSSHRSSSPEIRPISCVYAHIERADLSCIGPRGIKPPRNLGGLDCLIATQQQQQRVCPV